MQVMKHIFSKVTKFCKSMICIAISLHTTFRGSEQVNYNVSMFMNCSGYKTNIANAISMTNIGSINPSLRNDSASFRSIEEL